MCWQIARVSGDEGHFGGTAQQICLERVDRSPKMLNPALTLKPVWVEGLKLKFRERFKITV